MTNNIKHIQGKRTFLVPVLATSYGTCQILLSLVSHTFFLFCIYFLYNPFSFSISLHFISALSSIPCNSLSLSLSFLLLRSVHIDDKQPRYVEA
ncbi:hypothetical protein VNO78_01025 [Psophocarpus tetragonolobus]|uniref:Uncharacterized protein n=1 Tax=Psophocarpus tetragonolobus TaxID=3891 RepID=A0AAN9T8Q0_PSOTE